VARIAPDPSIPFTHSQYPPSRLGMEKFGHSSQLCSRWRASEGTKRIYEGGGMILFCFCCVVACPSKFIFVCVHARCRAVYSLQSLCQTDGDMPFNQSPAFPLECPPALLRPAGSKPVPTKALEAVACSTRHRLAVLEKYDPCSV